MRTLRLTKLSSLLVVALATSAFSATAHAGPIVLGLNTSKDKASAPLSPLLESNETARAQFDDDAAAMGLDAKAVKAADEALAAEKLSVGAHVYVSVDRRKKKVKVDAVGQAHITSSFDALLGMVPKGYAIEFKGKGLHFSRSLISRVESLAGMRITITGGNFILTDNSVLDMKGSSLTINGGSFEVHGNAKLNLTDSSISVTGGNVIFRDSSTVVLDGSSFSFSGAELPTTKAEFGEKSGSGADKSVKSGKAPTHVPLVAEGRIVLSDGTLSSTTGLRWGGTSQIVMHNKGDLIGTDALPAGVGAQDLKCSDGSGCVTYDDKTRTFRKRRRRHKGSSDIVTINIYDSQRNTEMVAPPAGTDWATHLDALVDKSAEK